MSEDRYEIGYSLHRPNSPYGDLQISTIFAEKEEAEKICGRINALIEQDPEAMRVYLQQKYVSVKVKEHKIIFFTHMNGEEDYVACHAVE